MKAMLEGVLLLIYFVSGEKLTEFYSLSRRVHKVRVRDWQQMAAEFYPRDEYTGHNYWRDAKRYILRQYALLALVVVLFIAAMYVAGPDYYPAM